MFKWTMKQPTKEGWYWCRRTGPGRFYDPPHIVYVRWYVDKLCIQNWPVPEDHTQWAGPIPMPKTIKRRML